MNNKFWFALKNGILMWFEYERARKALGKIVVSDIQHIELNPIVKSFQILTDVKVYELTPPETTKWMGEKWVNSLKMV